MNTLVDQETGDTTRHSPGRGPAPFPWIGVTRMRSVMSD